MQSVSRITFLPIFAAKDEGCHFAAIYVSKQRSMTEVAESTEVLRYEIKEFEAEIMGGKSVFCVDNRLGHKNVMNVVLNVRASLMIFLKTAWVVQCLHRFP